VKTKQWARENYKGVEDPLKTPFSLDFEKLDEDSIRFDVRQSIKHGFFSAKCSSTYTTLEEKKRFLEIACDEGRGLILIGANITQPTVFRVCGQFNTRVFVTIICDSQ
jgi:4-hydroxy-tetrahydrodipicolinate synthase